MTKLGIAVLSAVLAAALAGCSTASEEALEPAPSVSAPAASDTATAQPGKGEDKGDPADSIKDSSVPPADQFIEVMPDTTLIKARVGQNIVLLVREPLGTFAEVKGDEVTQRQARFVEAEKFGDSMGMPMLVFVAPGDFQVAVTDGAGKRWEMRVVVIP